jgi:hypothetical protein
LLLCDVLPPRHSFQGRRINVAFIRPFSRCVAAVFPSVQRLSFHHHSKPRLMGGKSWKGRGKRLDFSI